MQQLLHYFLHLLFPLLIAFLFYRKKYLKVYAILLSTMLVDLDHLLAVPIFEPCRCSIGYHPLHSYVAIIIYSISLTNPKLRVAAIGLLFHMVTDKIDCLLSVTNCN
jgi:hypothetical protein